MTTEPVARHDRECKCGECTAWFEVVGKLTGRCGRCSKPIDDHVKDRDGMMRGCP